MDYFRNVDRLPEIIDWYVYNCLHQGFSFLDQDVLITGINFILWNNIFTAILYSTIIIYTSPNYYLSNSTLSNSWLPVAYIQTDIVDVSMWWLWMLGGLG